MVLFEFKLPDIGEGVAEGEIVAWKVKVGDRVAEEQEFVEVMTDKATVPITSQYAGVVKELRFKEGETVPVHSVIAVFETDAAAPAAAPAVPAPAAKPAPAAAAGNGPTSATGAPRGVSQSAPAAAAASPGRVLAAPATRRRAREAGIDLAAVAGTGPSGRVTNEDLDGFLKGGAPAKPVPRAPAAPVTPAATPAAAPAPRVFEPVAIAPMAGSAGAAAAADQRVPFRGVRKKIAEAMTRSKHTATHFTVVEDLDVTELVALREAVKARYAERGIRITYMPFLMKAVVAGLRQFPWLNSSLDETTNEVVLKGYYHLGIATDTPNGLVVPVVRDVDRKNIVQLASELQGLAQRTREGKVTADELKGSTFSITNAGNLGGLMATPIINFPEVAILGVHKIHRAPRVVKNAHGQEEIRIRDVMYLSVSIDHRIVDGADGVRFLNVLKSCLEDPRNLILEA